MYVLGNLHRVNRKSMGKLSGGPGKFPHALAEGNRMLLLPSPLSTGHRTGLRLPFRLLTKKASDSAFMYERSVLPRERRKTNQSFCIRT